MDMSTKVRREVEPRWVTEYVVANYPNDEARYRVPLDVIPKSIVEQFGESKAARAYRPWRPEVDAIVIQPNKLILIEGKIFKAMDGLAKLPVYASLVSTTPELQAHVSKPRELQLLVVRALPWVLNAAKNSNVRVIEWAPPWIVQIWEERDKYWSPEAVAKRDQRKQKMQEAGLA